MNIAKLIDQASVPSVPQPSTLASSIDLIDVDTGTALGSMQCAAIVVALQSLFVSEDRNNPQGPVVI